MKCKIESTSFLIRLCESSVCCNLIFRYFISLFVFFFLRFLNSFDSVGVYLFLIILAMRRVNKKFNAKMAVNARSYEYLSFIISCYCWFLFSFYSLLFSFIFYFIFFYILCLIVERYVIPTFAFVPTATMKTQETSRTTEPTETTGTTNSTDTTEAAPTPNTSRFEFTDQIRQKVNQVLELFVGTHRFHNFTLGKKPTDESAKRFIMSFSVC